MRAIGEKALADLVAVVDQVSRKNQAAPVEDGYDRHRSDRSLPSLSCCNTNV